MDVNEKHIMNIEHVYEQVKCSDTVQNKEGPLSKWVAMTRLVFSSISSNPCSQINTFTLLIYMIIQVNTYELDRHETSRCVLMRSDCLCA